MIDNKTEKRQTKFKDLTGLKFERLTVLNRNPCKTYKILFDCICTCGNKVTVSGSNLKTGITKSCGCLNSEKRHLSTKTHGKRNTSEYNSWRGMKNRCYAPTHNRFQHYGGRGIKVCDRWLNSFENFYEDMGPKPGVRYSIDRINVDGNYEPGNCRWATNSEQRINIRAKKCKH